MVLFFEVRLVEECLARGVEHALGGDTTYVLKGVDNPCVDFVAEFVKEDIVLVNHLGIAVYVDFVAGKHGGQLDVVAVLADSQRHLFGTQEHFGLLCFLVKTDSGDTCGRQSALYEEGGIGSIVDYIDVLVAELAHDTVDSGTFDTHAGANGVDTVVVALNGNLGALSRYAGHGADS